MQDSMKNPDGLRPGDIVSKVVLVGPRGEPVDITAPPFAGRTNMLVLAGTDGAATAGLLAALATQRDALDSLGARCFLVTRPSGPVGQGLPGLGAPAPAMAPPDIGEAKAGAMRLLDRDGALFRRAGLAGSENGGPSLLVIGPNLHVVDIDIDITGAARGDAAAGAAVDGALDRLRQRAARRETGMPGIHPPILAVPDVFSPADCADLISIFHTRGQEFVESGHLALGNRTTDCKMRIPDLGRRDRIDHWVVEADTQRFITERLQARLFPEIGKAYNYQVTRHERYRIARYEGERGGEQMGHRDNIEPSVAHRRFAVTINLNSADYDGAELRFPEFSDQLYKPDSGTAIVFSCALLHEVVGMRQGSRFALLAFLFGEQ